MQCITQCITQQNCHQSTITQLDYAIYNNHSVISNISSLIQLLQIIRREKRVSYIASCVDATLDVAKNPCLRHAPKARIQGTDKWTAVDGKNDYTIGLYDIQQPFGNFKYIIFHLSFSDNSQREKNYTKYLIKSTLININS